MSTNEITEAKELFAKLKYFLDQNDLNDVSLPIDKVLKMKIPKVEDKTVFKGFYLKPEISEMLDSIASHRKKSIKSDIVNIALEEYLTKEGLLKK